MTGPETAASGFLDDTSYLCEFVNLSARLLAVTGLQPGTLEGMDEFSLRAILDVDNDFLRLNHSFLSFASTKMAGARQASRVFFSSPSVSLLACSSRYFGVQMFFLVTGSLFGNYGSLFQRTW